MARAQKIPSNIQLLDIGGRASFGHCVHWLDLKNPSKKEIEYLRKHYNFSLHHLQASSIKASSQRTQFEKGEDYSFIILHFPVYRNGSITKGEVEFFVGHDYLITIHDGSIDSLNHFHSLARKDPDLIASLHCEYPILLLCEIIKRILLESFSIIDQNSLTINELEDIIFEHESKLAVSQILLLRRNILNTRKIMQNHKNIIGELGSLPAGFAPQRITRAYIRELSEHSTRFWEFLEIQKEMVEVLNSTNESLLNYHISDIMKTLTIFSVIVFPLTLLAAIFGMNTVNSMPFMNHPYGFWLVIMIMVLGSLGMLLFFFKKKWL